MNLTEWAAWLEMQGVSPRSALQSGSYVAFNAFGTSGRGLL